MAAAIEQARLFLEFRERRAEIDAACAALEAHRAEYMMLTKDQKEFLRQAERLFSEAPFAAMRYDAADVQRAFDAVGHPTRRTDRPPSASVMSESEGLLPSCSSNWWSIRPASGCPTASKARCTSAAS